jgi:hypothetical protein
MKKLKMYGLEWEEQGYGGGLCVIAAEDADEAVKLADASGWLHGDYSPEEIKGALYEGEACVLTSGMYQE